MDNRIGKGGLRGVKVRKADQGEHGGGFGQNYGDWGYFEICWHVKHRQIELQCGEGTLGKSFLLFKPHRYPLVL